MQYSQSKCFFLGPIISSVVALHTDFAKPWPAILCLAASNLSFIVCPAIFTLIFNKYYYAHNGVWKPPIPTLITKGISLHNDRSAVRQSL